MQKLNVENDVVKLITVVFMYMWWHLNKSAYSSCKCALIVMAVKCRGT